MRVDKDRRPDVNERYYAGGWPTVAVLTPSGTAIEATTYVDPSSLLELLDESLELYELALKRSRDEPQRRKIREDMVEVRVHLAGQFAGMIHVHVDESQRDRLEAGLKGIEGLSVVVAGSDDGDDGAGSQTVNIQVVGQDRPGILRQVAHVLAEAGANVEELRSEVVSAPMSGEALFQADVRLNVPETTSLDDLYHRLEDLADDIMVSLNHEVR